MKTVSKSVKIKGKPSVPFTYEAPESMAEAQAAFATAKGRDQIAEKLTMVEIFNYGFELKIRAKIQSKHTDEGGKTIRRNLMQAWILTPSTDAEQGWRDELLGYLTSGGGKTMNAWLDAMYEDWGEEAEAWQKAK